MSIYIRPFKPNDAESLLSFKLRNKKSMENFSPSKPEPSHTYEEQIKEIGQSLISSQKDQEYLFGIFLKDSNELIGKVSLTHISRGVFQSAYVGYSLDSHYTGKGYTTLALYKIVDLAFNQLNLHRIQAAVLPNNKASIRILEKNNFSYIGVSKKHLKINNVWQDHFLYSITVDDFL